MEVYSRKVSFQLCLNPIDHCQVQSGLLEFCAQWWIILNQASLMPNWNFKFWSNISGTTLEWSVNQQTLKCMKNYHYRQRRKGFPKTSPIWQSLHDRGFKFLSSYGYSQCFQVLYVTFCRAIMSAKWISSNKQPRADYMKRWLLDSCSSYKSKWIPLCRWMYVDFDGEFPSLIISSDISCVSCLISNSILLLKRIIL